MVWNFKGRAILAGFLFFFLSISAFADGTVLLARNSSDFKDSLTVEIEELLTGMGYEVSEEDSLKVLKDVDFSRFDGIIVVNTGKAGRPGRTVRGFLDQEEALPPSVVVTTFADPSKARFIFPDREGLDFMTSASLNDGDAIRNLARDIVSRLVLSD